MRAELLNKIQHENKSTLINLANLSLGDDEIEEAIKQIQHLNPHACQFNLDNNQLSDQGARLLSSSLRAFSELTELSIQFNHIGREGALALFALKKQFPQLDIAFHGNQITDVGEMLTIEQTALRSGPFTFLLSRL